MIRREREQKKRERVKELARIQIEEDECFRLIRSQNEPERLEGYRQHLPLLGRRHEITIQYDDSSKVVTRTGGDVASIRHTLTARPTRPRRITKSGTSLLAVAPTMAGASSGSEGDRLVGLPRCENAATRKALELAPFTPPDV